MNNKSPLDASSRYKVAYSVYRFFGREKRIHGWCVPEEIQKAAKESYDNKNGNFVGWVNRDRWSKFIDRRMVLDGWIELPF